MLYNEYHEQYALADEGFRRHHDQRAPRGLLVYETSANLMPRLVLGHTKRVKIAILGNVIAINDPVRMVKEIAMLDWKLFRLPDHLGFARGGCLRLRRALTLRRTGGGFEEAHDLIVKCWTTPGCPGLMRGSITSTGRSTPRVLPMQKPHPDIWFPGTGSPESVVWAGPTWPSVHEPWGSPGHHHVVEADLYRHRS